MEAMEDTRSQTAILVAKFFLIPIRVFVALMGFLAVLTNYGMRTCISVTITQLVVARNYSTEQSSGVCPPDHDESSISINSTSASGGSYEWSQQLQGFVLSSFYLGYLILHIPTGLMCEKYGAKWVLALGVLCSVVFTALTPLATVYGGAYGMIASRIIIGLGQASTFPCLSALVAQWVPVKERSMLGSLAMSGGQIGTILGNTLSGYILHNYTWPWVFYAFAFLGTVWFIFFVLFCTSDPGSHPFIGPKEKQYLFEEMGQINRRKDLPPTPWRAIFTSAPMLTMMLSQVGQDWGFFLIVTDLPKYMNDVLQFSVKNNGILSSVPFLFMWITAIGSGFLSDLFIERNLCTITTARKVNTTISRIGPSIFLLLASYAGCNRVLVVVCFTLCMGFMGSYFAGVKLTPIDLSPNYAGTVMSITNAVGALMGAVSPAIAGIMTPNTSLHEWRVFFWLSFFILNGTLIPYLIWTTADVQWWNDPQKKPT